ncbi:MAG: efflux transporter outer membrane subunit [Betaproteobacteria bacterium]|nr:efflux transporter outer membrane subunit [Betaproteobacteria bacterium]
MHTRTPHPKGYPPAFAVLLGLVLAGCSSMGPMPPVRLPAAAAFQANRGWVPARPLASTPRGAWWAVFGDPTLDRLEHQVAQANQSLQSALAAYDQATALVAANRAAFYPVLGTSLSASRSGNGHGTVSGTIGQAGPANSFDAGLAASWIPDLWGRVRLQVAAAKAGAQASAETLIATQLSLQGTLAETYLLLRVTDARIALGDRTVAAYRQALQLTQNRYHAGVATEADVAQARTQLLSAQVARTDLTVQRAQDEHAIAVLVGRPASSFSLAPQRTLPAVPLIPAGVPAQMLARRPDLASAEQRVAQANAQIGVARTAWLPDLTLSAQADANASRIAELVSAPSLFWSLGPLLSATVFDGGARRAQLAGAKASYRQAVAEYRQTALTAFQQVEDNLTAQRTLRREAVLQRQTVQAADTSLRLVVNQYKAGVVPYLDVIVAQTTATGAQDADLTLLGRRLAACVGLIQALGGGWNEADRPMAGDPPVRQANPAS